MEEIPGGAVTPQPAPHTHTRSMRRSAINPLPSVPQGPADVSDRPAPPGHLWAECSLMEVEQVVRVAGPPTPSPSLEGTYRIPVSIQRGTNQALLDSGC